MLCRKIEVHFRHFVRKPSFWLKFCSKCILLWFADNVVSMKGLNLQQGDTHHCDLQKCCNAQAKRVRFIVRGSNGCYSSGFATLVDWNLPVLWTLRHMWDQLHSTHLFSRLWKSNSLSTVLILNIVIIKQYFLLTEEKNFATEVKRKVFQG